MRCPPAATGFLFSMICLWNPSIAGAETLVGPSVRDSSHALGQRMQVAQADVPSKADRVREMERDIERLKKERLRLKTRMNESAALIQSSETRLSAIEARLDELEEQERLVRGSLLQSHDQIAELLGSLQRMGRNPPPVMITQRKDALKMVRSAMLLRSAFPGLKKQADVLSTRLGELVRVVAEQRRETELHRAEVKRHELERTRLSGLMSENKKAQTQRQRELDKLRRSIPKIAETAESEDDLIAQIDQKISENTELGRYNRELSQTPPTPNPVQNPEPLPPAADAGNATPTPLRGTNPPAEQAPPTTGEQDVAILMPHQTVGARKSTYGARNPGRLTPAIPFREAKGKLRRPASGRQILAFGKDTKYGAASKGITLQTRHAAQITAPCDGWVVYAGEFRSYGQLLIINAGGGYHILLAGLAQIDVGPGDFILVGAPVGTMRQSIGQTKRTKSDKGPILYVEFRKDGKPINPDPWWVRDQQRVQG